MVETFFELDELLVAIEAVREISSLPVVAMLTFDEQGETLGGVSAKQATEALADSGLAAIGANHGAGIQAALTALNEMHATNGELPLAAMPNIGLASLAGNKLVFPHATPEYFSDFAAHARSRRADHRRLLRDDAGRDPGDRSGRRRGADGPFAARRPRARGDPLRRRDGRGDETRPHAR